ncbi:helix-turn-helix domain-containing protein [Actinacidiphila glaucinigra]
MRLAQGSYGGCIGSLAVHQCPVEVEEREKLHVSDPIRRGLWAGPFAAEVESSGRCRSRFPRHAMLQTSHTKQRSMYIAGLCEKGGTVSELFDAVDALLARSRPSELPPPDVRARLRRADGLTQEEVAEVFGVSRLSFQRWETGLTTPRPEHRAAYSRLLSGWAAKHPQALTAGRSEAS